jgi:tetratricopeptide (TPR) repeat protein
MRIFCVLLAFWTAAASDRLRDVRERGAALESEKRWKEAAELYRSALQRTESTDAGDRLWLLMSLADMAFERQDYAQTEAWLRQAEVEGLELNGPERVRLLSNWGALHLVQGKLTAAERELSQSLQLGENVSAPEDRAAALHNLAAVEMHLGRLSEAAKHQTQALDLWRKILGERHYYVMKAWIGLSSLQGLRGDWRGAEDSLKHALAIGEPEEALASYAVVLDKLKRHKEAKAIRARLRPGAAPVPMLVDVKALANGGDFAIRSQ